MYEEKEHRINWILLLKRIIWYILIVIIILGIIALVTRCTKNSKKDDKPSVKVDLSNEVLTLREATLQYLTIDNLPQKENESRSVKLKYLIAKDFIEPLKDSEGNMCDTNESYSEITRKKNNYHLVTTVKCGQNKKTKKEYIGCFANCDGKICVGNKTDKGICEVKEEESTTTTNDTTKKTTKKTTPVRTTTPKKTSSSRRTTYSTQTTLRTIRRRTTSKKTVTTKSVTTKPVTTKPVTTKPVTTKPVTTKPVTTKPVTTKPVTTKPVTTKPVTTKPVTTKPVTTKPATTKAKTCYDHIKYSCQEGELTSDHQCKITVLSVDPVETQVGNPVTFYNNMLAYPNECFEKLPIGYKYTCKYSGYNKALGYIYKRYKYRLCPVGYTYKPSKNKCEKSHPGGLFVPAKVKHKYSYNKTESGYYYNGVVDISKCK